MAEFYTNAGRKLEVSAAAPATEDASGYGNLSYTEAPKVGNFGDSGPQDTINNYTPLRDSNGDAIVLKAQGSRDYGSAAVSMAYHEDNAAAMAIISTAHGTRSTFSVKDTLPNGDVRYFQCITPGLQLSGGGADDTLEVTTTFDITTKIIEVAAAS